MPSLERRRLRWVLFLALGPPAIAWGLALLLRGARVIEPGQFVLLGGILQVAVTGYALHAAWGRLRVPRHLREEPSPESCVGTLSELTFAVLDCETTGLEPDGGDRVVSLGAVRLRQGALRPEETFHTLVDPGRPVPLSSTRIHGLDDAGLRGAPSLEEVLPAFLRFVEGAVLVGHDVWFDLCFLRRGTDALHQPALERSHAVLDTRLLGKLVHGRSGDSLDRLAERLGVPLEGRHSALGDALIAGRILERLLPSLESRGMGTLQAVLAAQDGLRRA
jgi:DNA polymerase III epsilon subunit family exonuclease